MKVYGVNDEGCGAQRPLDSLPVAGILWREVAALDQNRGDERGLDGQADDDFATALALTMHADVRC